MKSDNTVPVVHFMCAALLYVSLCRSYCRKVWHVQICRAINIAKLLWKIIFLYLLRLPTCHTYL